MFLIKDVCLLLKSVCFSSKNTKKTPTDRPTSGRTPHGRPVGRSVGRSVGVLFFEFFDEKQPDFNKKHTFKNIHLFFNILDTGYWILDTACWILDTGYWILDYWYTV